MRSNSGYDALPFGEKDRVIGYDAVLFGEKERVIARIELFQRHRRSKSLFFAVSGSVLFRFIPKWTSYTLLAIHTAISHRII